MIDQPEFEYPPRQTETPIAFANVRQKMFIRVVREKKSYIYGTYARHTPKVLGEGEVVSNIDGVIILKCANGVTITIKRSEIDRNTHIYKVRPARSFIPGIDDYTNVPVDKTN